MKRISLWVLIVSLGLAMPGYAQASAPCGENASMVAMAASHDCCGPVKDCDCKVKTGSEPSAVLSTAPEVFRPHYFLVSDTPDSSFSTLPDVRAPHVFVQGSPPLSPPLFQLHCAYRI